MKKLSLKEVKHRIRNHEALPDDVLKWYPKLMSRYTIRKAKRNPSGFTGKESRPRLKRYGKGEYRRSARSKELYPRAFVKNPSEEPFIMYSPKEIERLLQTTQTEANMALRAMKRSRGRRRESYRRRYEVLQSYANELAGYLNNLVSIQEQGYSRNPSRISRIKSHVKAHLDKDQRDFQKEIDEDDKLKKWLEKNPKGLSYEIVAQSDNGIEFAVPVSGVRDAVKTAKETATRYPHLQIYIAWLRTSDGQRGYLNPDMNYELTGYPWNKKHRNPYSSRSRFKHERLESPSKFDKRSFRTITQPDGTEITIGCPKGKWDAKRKRCKVGTRAQRILKPKRKNRNPKRYRKMRNGDLVLAQGDEKMTLKCASKLNRNQAATYEQYKYLLTFDNVKMNCNVSSFTTRISKFDASEAIDAAKRGEIVEINR